jgi:hypothetical protein
VKEVQLRIVSGRQVAGELERSFRMLGAIYRRQYFLDHLTTAFGIRIRQTVFGLPRLEVLIQVKAENGLHTGSG